MNSQEKTALEKINLLTYNIFIRPPGINNNGNDYKDKRMDLFCKNILSFYDIVCLQEMFNFGSTRKSNLIKIAEQSGFPYYKSSRKPCFFTGIDGGLLLLSRYPLVRTDELIFSKGAYSDRFSYKGCLYAKVQVLENFHFHIFCTHTQASYDNHPPLSEISVQTRLEQIGEIRHFMEQNLQNKPKEEPVFFMGDLNVNGRVSTFENDHRSSAEYLAMYQILCEGNPNSSEKNILSWNFRDLLKEKFGYHPITYGNYTEDQDGNHKPKEKVLTLKSDLNSCLSLDYIFLLDESKEAKEFNSGIKYKAEVTSTQIEEMLIDNPTQDFPCTQLSDHYGVSTQIMVKRI